MSCSFFALSLLNLMLTSCGGSDPKVEEPQIRNVVNGFQKAILECDENTAKSFCIDNFSLTSCISMTCYSIGLDRALKGSRPMEKKYKEPIDKIEIKKKFAVVETKSSFFLLNKNSGKWLIDFYSDDKEETLETFGFGSSSDFLNAHAK